MAANCLPDFEFVFVEGGDFMMGGGDVEEFIWDVDECQPSSFSSELPGHPVELSNFYIGKFPVTQQLWQIVMGSNLSYFKGEKLPLAFVSWDDIQKFLTRLNARSDVQEYIDSLGCTGKQFRLPTEAEWEYAASGGRLSRGYVYAGSDRLAHAGWYSFNSPYYAGEGPHNIGMLQPNELGICDMSGNVYEVCSDWYSYDYYADCLKQGRVNNPKGPSKGDSHVIRGGDYTDSFLECRIKYRGKYSFSNLCYKYMQSPFIGFRLAI